MVDEQVFGRLREINRGLFRAREREDRLLALIKRVKRWGESIERDLAPNNEDGFLAQKVLDFLSWWGCRLCEKQRRCRKYINQLQMEYSVLVDIHYLLDEEGAR